MSKKIASDGDGLPSAPRGLNILEPVNLSQQPAMQASSGNSYDEVSSERSESSSEAVQTLGPELRQILDVAGPGMTTLTGSRELSSQGESIVLQFSSSQFWDRDILRTYANSVGAAAAVFAQSSGPGVYYGAPTIDKSDGKTFKAEAQGDGRIAIAPTLLDLSTNSNITLMSGAEKTEQLQKLGAEADFFSSKKFYEDNGKTCAVILNYLFRGWNGIVDTRHGADKDTEILENLFKDMGIDEDSIFISEEAPYEEVRKLLNRVIKLVKGGGYSSLIFAIGTHGGSTVNSLIVNERRSRNLVEIDLYEHIVYVLSKELIEIPKIFLVQACRNSQKNQLEKVPIDTTNVIRKEDLQEVCVVRATIPNRFAWRDPYNGSYFFFHLDSVLRERGADRRLRKVVLEVGNRTAKLPKNKAQIPHIEAIPCSKEYKFKVPRK